MGRWCKLALAAALAAATVGMGVPAPSVAQSPARPNIVFVLTDDLSWNLVQYMPHVQAARSATA